MKSFIEMERYKRVMLAFDWWVRVKMYRGKIGDDSMNEYLDRHYSILEVNFIPIEKLTSILLLDLV